MDDKTVKLQWHSWQATLNWRIRRNLEIKRLRIMAWKAFGVDLKKRGVGIHDVSLFLISHDLKHGLYLYQVPGSRYEIYCERTRTGCVTPKTLSIRMNKQS